MTFLELAQRRGPPGFSRPWTPRPCVRPRRRTGGPDGVQQTAPADPGGQDPETDQGAAGVPDLWRPCALIVCRDTPGLDPPLRRKCSGDLDLGIVCDHMMLAAGTGASAASWWGSSTPASSNGSSISPTIWRSPLCSFGYPPEISRAPTATMPSGSPSKRPCGTRPGTRNPPRPNVPRRGAHRFPEPSMVCSRVEKPGGPRPERLGRSGWSHGYRRRKHPGAPGRLRRHAGAGGGASGIFLHRHGDAGLYVLRRKHVDRRHPGDGVSSLARPGGRGAFGQRSPGGLRRPAGLRGLRHPPFHPHAGPVYLWDLGLQAPPLLLAITQIGWFGVGSPCSPTHIGRLLDLPIVPSSPWGR